MIKNITINPEISIRQAMKAMTAIAEKCLVVVDDNKKILGTLTDGDLRRSILSGRKFTKDISKSYNTKPTMLIKNKYTIKEAKYLLREKKLDLIPIVDQNNMLVDYVTWSNMNIRKESSKKLINVPVVIMAGGMGTRLEPVTKILPKPLVPIQEKPIIEHIIERFTAIGCSNFYLTVSYKSKILKAYFEELQPDYNSKFINEEKPLGTASSLGYLKGKFNEPFFVSNCDIIINTDYVSIYDYHKAGGYDITLIASAKEYIIPYGTCELNNEGYLSRINEQPQYDFLINTGLYILNPNVLNLIPKNRLYHLTHLIDDVMKEGKKVGVFPVNDEDWIDIGHLEEYKKIVNKIT